MLGLHLRPHPRDGARSISVAICWSLALLPPCILQPGPSTFAPCGRLIGSRTVLFRLALAVVGFSETWVGLMDSPFLRPAMVLNLSFDFMAQPRFAPNWRFQTPTDAARMINPSCRSAASFVPASSSPPGSVLGANDNRDVISAAKR